MHAQSPNVHDEEPFKYSPLCTNDGIRLVKLLPASFHEPIACALVHTTLDSNPSYEALSYTWGNHQNTMSIKVDGRSFGITHNLGTALRYLRKERETTFWIDAICINQNDDKERTQQVALMTSIYQRALQVQIWLGPAADNSEMVMELFEKFVGKPMKLVNQSLSDCDSLNKRSCGRTRSFWRYLVAWVGGELDWPERSIPTEDPDSNGEANAMEGPASSEVQWLKQYLMDEKRVRLRRALEALLEREYWYRAWVVQEVLMASRISLNCGSHSVPWECVTTVVKAFMDERSRKLHDSRSEINIMDSIQTISMKSTTLETFGHLAAVRLDDHDSRGPRWLLEMLLKLRHFRSKDPRDKIFSLLGLINKQLFQSSPSKVPTLSVDYSLSFLEVSAKLFEYYFLAPSHSPIVNNETPEGRAPKSEGTARYRHKGSMNILCASQPTNRSTGFPSWLPDFSRDNGMEHWPCFEGAQYARFEGAKPTFCLGDSLLGVTGVMVTMLEKDCVTDKSDDPEATDDACLLTRVRNFMLVAEKQKPSALANADFWSALQLGKDDGEAIMNTLGVGSVNKPDSDSLLDALERGIKEQNRAVISFLDYFRRGSRLRSFAILRISWESLPAMVPADAQPGDGLFLLRGSDYPVLLRPVGGGCKNFEFVGPCFIPGWLVKMNASYYGPVKRIMLQ